MSIKTFIVDSFASEPFKGNPAGVCLLEEAIPDEKMLSIANELGFSETAFVLEQTANQYGIRYFTPKQETPLCGHATLASFKAINHVNPDILSASFFNIDGLEFVVNLTSEGLALKFPVYDTRPAEVPNAMISALGISGEVVNCRYNPDLDILVVEMVSDIELAGLDPDIPALIASHQIYGVVVTAKSSEADFDFKSRFFWPWSGTDEDPVTGGTHTILSRYWQEKLGKSEMNAHQCSPRGGAMKLNIDGDHVVITAQAHVMLHGELLLD